MPRDAKGNAYRLLGKAQGSLWPVRGDARMRVLQRRCSAVQQHGLHLPLLFLCWIGVWLAATEVTSMVLQAVGIWHRPASWVVGIVVSSAAMEPLRRRLTESRLARAVLQEGLCPCCGYNLHGLPRGPLGEWVCSECGLVAAANEVRRVEPFADGAGVRVGTPEKFLRPKANVQAILRDADGQEQAGAMERLSVLIRKSRGRPERERYLRARKHIDQDPLTRAVRWLLAFVVLAMGGGMAALLLGVGQIEIGLVVVACTMMGAAWVTFGHLTVSMRDESAALARQEFCPGCTADLRGVAADEQGVVACTGCLARWRSEQAGESRRLLLGVRRGVGIPASENR